MPCRIEKALEDERLAKEAEKSKREASDEKRVDVSTYQPLHPLSHSSKPKSDATWHLLRRNRNLMWIFGSLMIAKMLGSVSI